MSKAVYDTHITDLDEYLAFQGLVLAEDSRPWKGAGTYMVYADFKTRELLLLHKAGQRGAQSHATAEAAWAARDALRGSNRTADVIRLQDGSYEVVEWS